MKTVFLDLDGTLTDPKPGITLSAVYALEKVGVPAPPAEELTWMIGPALLWSFEKLGVPDPQAALEAYRERYTDTGLFENRVFDGIPEVLSTLRDSGFQMCIATAKPHAYARRITEKFGLAPFMAHEFGPELDGTRNDKAELLAHALQVTGADPDSSVMIGDRHHDFDAARANGMASIAVTWGYGSDAEWQGATHICRAVADIPGAVRSLLG